MAVLLSLLLASSAFSDAVALYKKGDFMAAVPKLRQAVEQEKPGSPEHAESLLLLGQSYFMTAKYEEAIPWLEKRRALGPRQELDYMLGTALIFTNRAEKAVAAFAAMYDLPAGSAAAHLITAQMMMRNNLEDAAVRQVERALAINPRLPGAHRVLGELALYRGQLDSAVESLRKEVALNPASAEAHYKLGDALSRREEWPTAIAALQRAVWLNPSMSGPYILLGKAYLRTDSLANAEGILRRALHIDPQNKTANYLLSQTLMRAGRPEEAKQVTDSFRELLQKD
jgi:tetratricopeptide (TPR) repeat protein